MKLKQIISRIEALAPLSAQDGFDNSGLQTGFPEQEIDRVLVCLDVTEEVLREAERKGCGLILSHHPLLFHPLRQVSDSSCQQRCVVAAIKAGIAVYSAHTSLDNSPGGVNHKIAELIGLDDLRWLSPKEGMEAGSGLVGTMRNPLPDGEFLDFLKARFKVAALRHSETCGKTIRRVALCGGAGAFLLADAIREDADCFISGEFHYHDYFENKGVLLAELGHYQSEQYTSELLRDWLHGAFPELQVSVTGTDTNPIRYR